MGERINNRNDLDNAFLHKRSSSDSKLDSAIVVELDGRNAQFGFFFISQPSCRTTYPNYYLLAGGLGARFLKDTYYDPTELLYRIQFIKTYQD